MNRAVLRCGPLLSLGGRIPRLFLGKRDVRHLCASAGIRGRKLWRLCFGSLLVRVLVVGGFSVGVLSGLVGGGVR